MNTPGLDKKGGKTLTRDGTKAVFVGQNTFKNGNKKGRFNKKGDHGKDGNNSNKGGPSNNKGKKKNSVIFPFKILSFIYIRINLPFSEIGR